MPYSELLFKIMQEKNLTANQIREMCKENGVEISEGYFSKVKNSRKNPPSEKISRAIAKVCDVDERKLIIEGYIDKAPHEIQEAFQAIHLMANIATIKTMDIIRKGKLQELKKFLETTPVSSTIIEILNSQKQFMQLMENNFIYEKLSDGMGITMLLKEPVGFIIEDDAMAPKIEKGDKVIIGDATNWGSTDILLVRLKKEKKLKARYVQKVNNTRILIPINKPYKESVCDKDELIIVGKITNVIKKI